MLQLSETATKLPLEPDGPPTPPSTATTTNPLKPLNRCSSSADLMVGQKVGAGFRLQSEGFRKVQGPVGLRVSCTTPNMFHTIPTQQVQQQIYGAAAQQSSQQGAVGTPSFANP